jgi:acetyltransferase-like isoleucine patch superfamily enzyme
MTDARLFAEPKQRHDPAFVPHKFWPNKTRLLLKAGANLVAALVVLSVIPVYFLAAALVGHRVVFPGWSQAFSLLPGTVGVYLRRAFYRLTLPHCGDDAVVSFGTVFSHPTVTIGRSAYIGAFCMIGDVDIGDDAVIASHVSIMNGSKQHGIARLDIPVREQPGEWPRVKIGQDTWIGDRAVIMADVGEHCVIGAGSVVTKPIPDYAIAVGNPARIVRLRIGETSDDTTVSPNSRSEKPTSETIASP